MVQTVELRCPQGPRALLAKIRTEQDGSARLTSENLLELSCRDCSKSESRARTDGRRVRVLHCFDVSGSLVESFIEER